MASMPSARWARRLGASPLKRMTASWSGSLADPTAYKVAARCFAPMAGSSGRFRQAAAVDRLNQEKVGIGIESLTKNPHARSCKRSGCGLILTARGDARRAPPFSRSMALITWSWPRRVARVALRQAAPWSRKMSATSRAGQAMTATGYIARSAFLSLLAPLVLGQQVGFIDAGDHARGDARVARRRVELVVMSRAWMMRMSVPRSKRWVAKLWRSECTVTGTRMPAALGRGVRQATELAGGDRLTRPAAEEQPALLRRHACVVARRALLPPCLSRSAPQAAA